MTTAEEARRAERSRDEETRRAVKAARIADWLGLVRERVPALTTDVLERCTEEERAAYALCAGARRPSERTWRIVIALLRDREARAPRLRELTALEEFLRMDRRHAHDSSDTGAPCDEAGDGSA